MGILSVRRVSPEHNESPNSLLSHGIIPRIFRVKGPAHPEVCVLAADPLLVQELEQIFRV